MNSMDRWARNRFFKSPSGMREIFAGLFVRHFGSPSPARYWRCHGVIWSFDEDDRPNRCRSRWHLAEERMGYFVAKDVTLAKLSHRIIGDWTSLIGVQRNRDSHVPVSKIFDDGHFFAEACCIDAGYWLFSSSNQELTESLALETNSILAEPGYIEYTWEAVGFRKSSLAPKTPKACAMYECSIQLVVSPEHHKVSVFVFNQKDELLLLGDKLHARFNEAYMSGHNWDALIRRYLDVTDPDLMQSIETDPESGMFEAYMPYSLESIEKMARFESHVRKLVSDEAQLFEFIEEYRESIE